MLGLVGSYLGIYFYLRVIQFMFMSPARRRPPATRPRAGIAMGAGLLCLAGSIVIARAAGPASSPRF